jgi:hypothetical protein
MAEGKHCSRFADAYELVSFCNNTGKSSKICSRRVACPPCLLPTPRRFPLLQSLSQQARRLNQTSSSCLPSWTRCACRMRVGRDHPPTRRPLSSATRAAVEAAKSNTRTSPSHLYRRVVLSAARLSIATWQSWPMRSLSNGRGTFVAKQARTTDSADHRSQLMTPRQANERQKRVLSGMSNRPDFDKQFFE